MPDAPLNHLAKFGKPRNYAAGVYRLRGPDGDLLYLGVGADPLGRIKAHAKKVSWWSEVDLSRSGVEWFGLYEHAQMAERLAVRLEQPKYNMIWSKTRPHWSHERGAQPWRGNVADGAEIKMGDVAHRLIEDIVLSAKHGRRCCYIVRKNWPSAAVVPVELARLAQWAGGPDRAGQVLLRHIMDGWGGPPPTEAVEPRMTVADLTDNELLAEVRRRMAVRRA